MQNEAKVRLDCPMSNNVTFSDLSILQHRGRGTIYEEEMLGAVVTLQRHCRGLNARLKVVVHCYLIVKFDIIICPRPKFKFAHQCFLAI